MKNVDASKFSPKIHSRWGTNLWTKEEDDKLREVYPFIFSEEAVTLFPNRTLKQIRGRAGNIKLRRGRRKVLFPREYINDIDGGYVSGLVDGEGWFAVSLCRRGLDTSATNFNPRFGMTLRIDDKPILDWLQAYFDCGKVRTSPKRKSPASVFLVGDLYNLLRSIIPHFEKYPLRAKKKKDYEIWKQMIYIQAETFRGDWNDSIRRKMMDLYEQMKRGRRLSLEAS